MEAWLGRLIEPKAQIPEARKRFSNAQLKDLIVPVVIEQMLILLVGLADSLMISQAGEAAVSAVSLVNQLNNVFIMLFTALAAGGSVIASQYVGSGDREKGSLAAGQLVMLSCIISLIVMSLVLAFASAMIHGLFGSAERAVVDNALIYLRITTCSIPFLAIYNSCSGILRSMGKTRIIMNVSIVMNLINVAGNAIGVLVLKAGVAGVAYPTLISHIFAAITMLALARNPANAIRISLKSIFAWKPDTVVRIFRVAVPNAIENALFQFSKVALTAIIATFGTVQIAAYGMAQTIWSLSALFSMAIGPVFITVIGQYMGANDPEGADYFMKKLLRISTLCSLVWSVIMLALTPPILHFSNLGGETTNLIFVLVILHNVTLPVLHPLAFPMSSGLRAAGDIRYTMYAAIFATVVCRVAFSILFAVVLHMGVIGITLAMALDWLIKSILIGVRYRSGKWKTFKLI